MADLPGREPRLAAELRISAQVVTDLLHRATRALGDPIPISEP